MSPLDFSFQYTTLLQNPTTYIVKRYLELFMNHHYSNSEILDGVARERDYVVKSCATFY